MVVVGTSVALVGGAGPAGAKVSTIVQKVASGVTLTKIYDPSGPFRIRVLTINPAKAVMLDVALSTPTFGSFATTSSMARANGAIAAVNGDFGTWPERPVHAFADDGTLKTTGSADTNFALSQDETTPHIGHAQPAVRATVAGSGQTFVVNAWNTGHPKGADIDGYTTVGGSTISPPSAACSVRLVPSGVPRWGAQKVGILRDYTVDAEACQSSPMSLNGGVVLAARRASATASATIMALTPGSTLTLSWSMGWADVSTTIGGAPELVSNGKVVTNDNCGNYFCARNPRTGIGYTATGRILLVTVDGRQSGWSVGMTLVEFAKEMIKVGAVRAMNLDGGGSTTMWVKSKGGLVNRPSDWTGERAVSSAVLVLPAAETEALAGVRGPAASAVSPSAVSPSSVPAAVTWNMMESDPASTGGLMDALVGGAFGRPRSLPAQWRAIARRFRSSFGR